MRKRIKELAEGRVVRTEPVVEFSVSRIEMEVHGGKDCKGEFTIASKNQVPIRGLVYSSNPRMECLTEGFEGEEIQVSYKFHSFGLTEGDTQEGDFFIVCGQGEYTLPFVVSVSGNFADTQEGIIKNLTDFKELARNHWQKAKKLFYSPEFINILNNCEEKERYLHMGLARGAKTDRSLEEFLLAIGLKEQIYIEIDQKEYVFDNIVEKIRQDIILVKNTWGYEEFRVESDAEFMIPIKREITTEDFLGSELKCGFFIDPQKMHAGKNFGRLTLRNMRQESFVSICAVKGNGERGASQRQRQIRKLHIDLMQTYIDYRLRKIVTGRWAYLTCGILDSLMAIDDSNDWYRLFKAQALWTNGQKQEAEWILNEFKRKHRDRESPQWGYYMYICTLMDHEELYVDRLTEEIEEIYLKHRGHLLLFFCLLFLRRDYVKNGYQKLKALERQIMGGTESPLFYVEVYSLFCQEPYLMSRLGDFEIKILNWARKQKMMTKALMDQFLSIFPEKMPYRKTVFLLLEECYQMVDHARDILYERPKENALAKDKRVLSVLCGYLIRNQKYGEIYFPWYEKGVEERLRITGLYEAYLMSMDARSVLEVPKIIQMYFKYNSQLRSRQKAVLYVNMIAAKERQPESFKQHYPAMEKFAYEQMEQGHIDDDLAVIYQETLSHGIYSSQVSDVLADVLFVHRLTCSWKQAARVIILQNQMELQYVAPLVDQRAYFPLYSNDYMIFIEDRQGRRYAGSVDYQLEKLMHPGKYLRACMEKSPEKLPYLLYYFAERKAQDIFEEEDLGRFLTVLSSDKVNWAYKASLFPKMFFLMHELNRTEDMERELAKADISFMSPEERSRILAICLEQRMYDRVFQIIKEYRFIKSDAAVRVPFLNAQIEKWNFAEDKELLRFCAETFFDGKYNDVMLIYLNLYYKGPLAYMLKIFHASVAFGICTKEISERILVQMLYTSEMDPCIGEVYKSFKEGGDKTVKAAYLSYFSYCSLTGQNDLPQGFFEDLQEWWLQGNELNEICSIAMLKYYANQKPFGQEETERMEELLEKCLIQGLYFDFYRNFNRELMIKHQLYDKYYIEYKTKKDARIWLHYIKEGEKEYTTEEMAEVYEGFYVKKMILFAGDAVQYNILEEKDGAMEIVKSDRVVCSLDLEETDEERPREGRYAMLNRMLLLKSAKDEERLAKKMLEYGQMDFIVEDLFSIIK